MRIKKSITITGAYDPPYARGVSTVVLRAAFPVSLELVIRLGVDEMELGRNQIEHLTVSRRHFAVRFDPKSSQYLLRDLGSRNKTRVNGVVVATEEVALEVGSVVRTGDVLLVVEEEAAQLRDATMVSKEAIPGEAASTKALRSAVARAAADSAPVLLLGETGTGKEKIAGELHRLSGRTGNFVGINCAGLNAQLVESQLFGHVRGAFTGADAAQQGLFRSVDGGTLLLDEIGDLPLDLQPKLLRVLQEGEVLPIGSSTPVPVDVRIIAATHRDLAKSAEEGSFRNDLYARLSIWEVRVPPLRHRRADILGWIDRLSARRPHDARASIAFGPNAAEALLVSSWTTNLRGVDRLVHELEINEGQPVAREQLPKWLTREVSKARAASAKPTRSVGTTPAPTREVFESVFAQLEGNVRATAKHFNRDRRQIYRWIKAYGLKAIDDER